MCQTCSVCLRSRRCHVISDSRLRGEMPQVRCVPHLACRRAITLTNLSSVHRGKPFRQPLRHMHIAGCTRGAIANLRSSDGHCKFRSQAFSRAPWPACCARLHVVERAGFRLQPVLAASPGSQLTKSCRCRSVGSATLPACSDLRLHSVATWQSRLVQAFVQCGHRVLLRTFPPSEVQRPGKGASSKDRRVPSW